MVNWLLNPLITEACLLAEDPKLTALERMSPQQRAKVLAALAGFVILGFGMLALTWLGARVTRRYMNQEPLRRREVEEFEDDWSSKPLVPPGSAADNGDEQE